MHKGIELRAVVVVDCVGSILPPSDQAAATQGAMSFCEATAFCPTDNEVVLRYALAAGCSGIALSLEQHTADVYLIGRGGAGPDGDLMAARLAIALDAHLVLDVLDVKCERGELRINRDLGRGTREILALSGPAVLVMADDAPQPKYVSRYRRNSVPVPEVAKCIQTLDDVRWEPVRRRTKTADLSAKTTGDASSRMFDAFGLNQKSADASTILTGDAETCARHLLRYLAHHGFIDRSYTPPSELTIGSSTVESADSPGPLPTLAKVPNRTPRSLERPSKGNARCPRAYFVNARRNPRLARAPRLVCGGRIPNRRGPYQIENTRKRIDG